MPQPLENAGFSPFTRRLSAPRSTLENNRHDDEQHMRNGQSKSYRCPILLGFPPGFALAHRWSALSDVRFSLAADYPVVGVGISRASVAVHSPTASIFDVSDRVSCVMDRFPQSPAPTKSFHRHADKPGGDRHCDNEKSRSTPYNIAGRMLTFSSTPSTCWSTVTETCSGRRRSNGELHKARNILHRLGK